MQQYMELIRDNIAFLHQGIALLENIEDHIYQNDHHTYFQNGVGKHFRHVLDHYGNFFDGIITGIDYDARERDPRLESDRAFAIEKSQENINALTHLENRLDLFEKPISIKCNEGIDNCAENLWSESNLKRELSFLISHTVHHYAMIALILRIQGSNPPADFGIAPSTLKHQEMTLDR